jgi:hypothetical protein
MAGGGCAEDTCAAKGMSVGIRSPCPWIRSCGRRRRRWRRIRPAAQRIRQMYTVRTCLFSWFSGAKRASLSSVSHSDKLSVNSVTNVTRLILSNNFATKCYLQCYRHEFCGFAYQRLASSNAEPGAGSVGPCGPCAPRHLFLFLDGHQQRGFPTDSFSHRGKGDWDGNLPQVRPQVPDGTHEGTRTPGLVREGKVHLNPPARPYRW